ncbi:MAG: hypothetical protein JXA03_15930 [Bacteroidales bacterium]|nr:hypothetical protein [Bacteroidales bacterium]
MSDILTIPKDISTGYGKDYAYLRSEGLKYIEALAHKLWTDYNVHDPGVTILEMLCYAITDLGYRIAMPVEDILASPKDNLKHMHEQFLSAIKALPSCPVSADDYRQLFIRIEGIRNAWITASDRRIVAKFKDLSVKGIPELHYKSDGEVNDPKKAHEFKLRGLNNILLDYDEPNLLSDKEKDLGESEQELLIAQKKDEIVQHVKEVYHRYRNLCEDLDSVKEVPLQGVVICGDIDIEPNADPEQVWAEIVSNIDRYLSPDVPFYSLQEMQEMGKTTDEIFDGPVFDFKEEYHYRTSGNPFSKKGFICKEDLIASGLRAEVRLSDIIRIIMNTKGVKLIKEIAFGLCSCDEKDMNKVREAVKGDKWNLCISPGHKPVFCLDNSVLNMWKDLIPIELKMEEALDDLAQLREDWNSKQRSRETEDIPMPDGEYRYISDYQTFQNDFPETYGIGHSGLPDSATTERKAQAKQLKAYLLFFEQVLANYFAQLANISVLFSADKSIARTYFANAVKGLKEVEEIFDHADNWEDKIESILKDKGLDPYVTRKNMFLDHLLARFAEQFNDYVFLMHRLYAEDADQAIIRHKVDFLDDYYNVSTSRASGFDFYNSLTLEEALVNVPGMEKRISRLLGFNHYKRLSLAKLAYHVEKTAQGHNWSISMGADVILGSENKTFAKKADAYEEMGLASLLGCEAEYYKAVLSDSDQKVSFNLVDTKGKILAAHPDKYDVLEGELETGSYSLLNIKIEEIISYFLKEFRLEGMYVVEHLLLRPDFDIPITKTDLFLPVCIEPDGSYCRPLDPYSFRVTVILPGYSMRLRNKYFRRLAERLIRMETPAHVLPRICFINEEFMKKFEDAYNNWLNERQASEDPMKQASDEKLKTLIEVLEEMYTVYEEGQLADCDDDTEEKNPVVLGSSKLGSLENDSNPG